MPFGEDFGESGEQQKQHFTSYERDSETGTDYAMNRQYGQSVGRFNRVDPLASSADKGSPQSWNRYAYAVSDPVNKVDRMGLYAFSPTGEDNPCDAVFGVQILPANPFDTEDILCFIPLILIPILNPAPEPELPFPCPAQDFNFAQGSGLLSADELSALAMTAIGEAGTTFDLDEIQAVIASVINRQTYNLAYQSDHKLPHFGDGSTNIIDILQGPSPDGYVAYRNKQGVTKLEQAIASNPAGYLVADHYVCAQLMAAKAYAITVGMKLLTVGGRSNIWGDYPITFNLRDLDNNARRRAPNRRHYGQTTFWSPSQPPSF